MNKRYLENISLDNTHANSGAARASSLAGIVNAQAGFDCSAAFIQFNEYILPRQEKPGRVKTALGLSLQESLVAGVHEKMCLL